MKYKLICCEVFMRIACMEIAHSPNTIDPEFTNLGAHENPDRLRESIQKIINNIKDEDGYDAILLGYGLCGNSTVSLKATSIPLVIPRAHDCCTILLGSKDKFIEHFENKLSSKWSSVGYMERSSCYLRETEIGKMLGLDKDYQQLVEQYGEENAQYIWETLHPDYEGDELIYIKIPELESLGYLEKFKKNAISEGKNVRIINGSKNLIHKLINGKWTNNEFLIIPPEKSITAVYDHKEVMRAE
jgi:hypothetical protein